MSGINVEHHVYGSTPREFTTRNAPAGWGRSVLAGLESRCGYALPMSLINRDDVLDIAPLKYTFFRVDDFIAIGRARYLGIDMTGRRGNYICHNLLLRRDEVMAAFETPVDLIRAAESQGLFLDAVPPEEGPLPASTLMVPDHVSDAGYGGDEHLAQQVLSHGFRLEQAPPIFVIGQDGPFLDFMSWACRLLPFSVRWKLSFDSYTYGASVRELTVVGLPDGREYTPPVPAHSLKVTLPDLSFEMKADVAIHPLAGLVATLDRTGSEQKDVLLSLIDLAEDGLWEEFADTCNAAAEERTIVAVYRQYRQALVGTIQESQDVELLAAIWPGIATEDDLDRLSARPELVLAAAHLRKEVPLRALVEWVADDLPPAQVAVAFSDDSLLPAVIERIGVSASDRAPEQIAVLLERLARQYSSYTESLLLDSVTRLRAQRRTSSAAGRIIRALTSLPGSESQTCTRLHLRWLLGDPAAARLLAEACVAQPDYLTSNAKMVPGLLRSTIERDQDVTPVLSALARASVDRPILGREVAEEIAHVLEDENLGRRQAKAFRSAVMKSDRDLGSPMWFAPAREAAAGSEGFLSKIFNDRKGE